jgi:predicted small secreted protein
MKTWKTAGTILCAILISSVLLASCNQKPVQGIAYDPTKKYAAFLVLNTAVGKNALENMKIHSAEEQYEIGPVEYYDPGSKDFESILRKLTVNQQVKLVWIISSLWDVADIKTAMTKIDYKGPYRYVPITDQTGAIKIDQ